MRLDCVFQDAPKDRHGLVSSERSPVSSSDLPQAMAQHVIQNFHKVVPGLSLQQEHSIALSQLLLEAFRQECQGSHVASPWGVGEQINRIDSDDTRVSLGGTGSDDDGDTFQSRDGFIGAVSEAIINCHHRNLTSKNLDDHVSHALDTSKHLEDPAVLEGAKAKSPPLEEAEYLVDTFFRYLEANWYYFDERRVRDMVGRLYHEAPLTTRLGYSEVCLLLLVFALASSFAHLDRQTSAPEVPGLEYYKGAMALMPAVVAQGSLESVQCCLLIALYALPTQISTHHYTYLGLALRIAIGLSLHRNARNSDVSPEDREIRTRVFWTTYCIERWISGMMAQPIMLQTDEITAPLPQRRADLDESSPRKIDRLVAFTKLTLIKDQFLSTAGSSVKPDSERYDQACSRLGSWKQALPVHLSLLSDEKSLRSNAHLDLMYNMIWVRLGRSALLPLARMRLQSSRATNEASVNPDAAETATERVISKCLDAATRILDIIALLHSRNRLAKFSFTDLNACSSAIIILLLGGLFYPWNPETSPGSSTISKGIEAMRFLATGTRLAGDALSLVERFQTTVRKHTSRAAPKVGHGEATTLVSAQPAQMSMEEFASSSTMLGCEDEAGYTPSDFASLDPTWFSDFEPSLLEYDVPDLTLFGFDGFHVAPETDDSAWSW
ncbi:putative transcriptional regulatory protein C3C7.04 [Exophiala dermatitidis]